LLEFQKYLNPNFIIIEPNVKNKKEFFSTVVSFLSKKLDIKKSVLLKELSQREALGSTGIGNGIAIPHCRIDSDLKIQILVVISEKGIDFSAIDSKLVHLFFVIVAPPKEQVSYFRVLSHLAKTLEKGDIYSKLLIAKSKDDVYSLLMNKDL